LECEPPARFCTTTGMVTIFSSVMILATLRMITSGVPPGPDPTVISTGPRGAFICASAGNATRAASAHAVPMMAVFDIELLLPPSVRGALADSQGREAPPLRT
jgi:hypothetical protein